MPARMHFNTSSSHTGRLSSHRELLSLLSFLLPSIINNIKDSAEWYENERECGRAILDFCVEFGVLRTDIFFTTKLKHNAGFDATINAINRSLELCGLDYIDLYLIHGPWGGPDARQQAWEACVAAQKAGKVKSIGISTFGMRHMEELVDSGLPLPAVHQVRSDTKSTWNRIDI